MSFHKAPRRAIWAIVLGLALASCALAQEGKGNSTAEPSAGWQWANFVILAIGLGYLIRKNVPPMFQKQSAEIQSALRDAAKMKEEAAAYAAGLEARLANLQSEIDKLRVDARSEMDAEGARIRRDTEHHMQRIREQTAGEMELLTRSAKDELRRYSAELAVSLAEQRIRAQMSPALQQSLAKGFLHDLRERTTLQAAN